MLVKCFWEEGGELRVIDAERLNYSRDRAMKQRLSICGLWVARRDGLSLRSRSMMGTGLEVLDRWMDGWMVMRTDEWLSDSGCWMKWFWSGR